MAAAGRPLLSPPADADNTCPRQRSSRLARAATEEARRRLDQAMARALDCGRSALDNFAGRLNSHSERHESLLARGYVVVHRPAGAGDATPVVTAAAEIAPGAALELDFHDGKVAVTADGASGLPPRKRGIPRRRGSRFTGAGQPVRVGKMGRDRNKPWPSVNALLGLRTQR